MSLTPAVLNVILEKRGTREREVLLGTRDQEAPED